MSTDELNKALELAGGIAKRREWKGRKLTMLSVFIGILGWQLFNHPDTMVRSACAIGLGLVGAAYLIAQGMCDASDARSTQKITPKV